MKPNFDDTRFSVRSFNSLNLRNVEFDYGVYSVGYERRSAFIPTLLNSTTTSMLGIELGGTGKCSYDANLKRARERKHNLLKKSALGISNQRFSSHLPCGDVGSNIWNVLTNDRTERGRCLRESLRVYITRTVGTPTST